MATSNVGSSPVSIFAADTIARVPADADLWAVAAALVEADVGALAVGQGADGTADVAGIVSERDVVRALADRRDLSTTTAMDVAQTRLVWCDVASTVAAVAEEMMEEYVRHVLLEDDGRVAGIVSARDLLGAYAAAESPDTA